jgi:hypothetical protein
MASVKENVSPGIPLTARGLFDSVPSERSDSGWDQVWVIVSGLY